MKLHLPTRLRQALVATFVAVTTFSTTLSSSTLIATGAVALSFAGTQALALDVTENTTWDADQTIAEDVQLDGDIRVDLNADVTVQGTLKMKNSAELAVKNGGVLIIDKLDLHNANNGNTEELIIESGATVYINGIDGDPTNNTGWAAATIGHWGGGGTGKVTMQGGELYVLNGTFNLGWDSDAYMEISGGTANLSKLLYSSSNNYPNKTATLTLSGEGRLNIGAGGISYAGTGTSKSLILNGGTVGALDNWTLSGNLNVRLGGDVTFDTGAHTIDVQKDITGAGTITKIGSGELILASVAGAVVVEEGVLRLNSTSAITSLILKSGSTAYVADGIAVGSTVGYLDNGSSQNTPYYTASYTGVDMSKITLEEGANLVQTEGTYVIEASANTRVYADASCVSTDGTLTIKSGEVMVCDPNNKTQVAQSIANASKIILDGGTLFSLSNVFVDEDSVSYEIAADIEIKQGGGTLRAYGAADTALVDRTTYTGDITGTGTLTKSDGGYVVLAGDVSGFSGSLRMEGGTLEVASSGTMILGSLNAANSTLKVADNVHLTLQGAANNANMTFGSNSQISLGAGSVLEIKQTNETFFSGSAINGPGTMKLNSFRASNTTLTIGGGAQLEMTNYRSHSGNQTIKVTDGSSIVVTGSTETNNQNASFLLGHWSGNVGLEVSGEGSYVEAKNAITRLGLDGTGTLTVKDGGKATLKGITFQCRDSLRGGFNLGVAEGGDATVLIGASGITDFGGASTMTLGNGTLGATAGWSMTGSNKVELIGTIGTVFDTDVYDVNIAPLMKGAGNFIKKGSGTLTLAGFEEFTGVLTISEGGVAFSQASSLNKLVTNGGSLVVDAAAPAVLTLGATEGVISLLVKNAASIADDGVDIFAGTLIPANANVVVESMVSDELGEDGAATGNQFVATYADGKLKKTALTELDAADLTWVVNGASNNWGLTTAANWDTAGTAQRWVDGSAVTFAGSGESINVVSAVTAASAAVAEGNYEWVLGADKLTITNGVTIAENASLTLTGLTVADSGNYSGVVTGAGTLVLKNMGMKALSQLSGVLSSTAEQTIDTVVIAEGSALQITGQGQRATLNNITHLVVEAGGRFDNRLTNTDNATAGMDITIAGAGDASLPGKDGVTTGPAAALTFGHECTAGDICTMARKVILSADATIYVASSKTGDLTSGMTTADHTLTLIGGGTLQWKAAEMEATKIVLDAASTLALYRTGNESTADPVAANQMYEIGTLQVSGGTKLKATNHASCIKIGQLVGSGVWNMEFAHSSSVISSSIVSGNASYDGTINVSVTNNNTRKGVFGTDDHDALSKTVVNIGTVTNSGAKAGFILANDGSETIQIAGLATGADVTAAQALLISNDAVSIESDGDSRTLEIVGGGTNTFGGTVLAGVNLLMNGTGTQGFTGNMDAFNGTIGVQKGTLNLVGVGSASAISLAGGTTLGVTEGVSGKALSVAAVGAVLSADLTMAGGSLALGTADAEWAKTGGLNLDGHKLVIDSANLGALSANLGTEEYTGEVVQLLTNVSAIEDAAGNALSITNETKVGSLFDTGTDSALGDYLLNWDAANGTLSLIMKGEIADLVWNDASDNNEWKNAGTHTNWKDGETDSRFVMGDNVSFSGSLGEQVTIVGTVNPLNVTVSSGEYTWAGDGSVEAAGKLTVGNDAHTTAQLKIHNTGKKSFAGGVELLEGAYLDIKNATDWNGKVSGGGQLILSCGGELNLADFIDTGADAASLATLKMAGDSTVNVESDDSLAALKKVSGEFIMADAFGGGARLNVTGDATMTVNKVTVNGAAYINVAAQKNLSVDGLLEVAQPFGGLSLRKEGEGTLTLTGGASALQQNAGIKLDGGTLKIADAGKLAEGSLGEYKIYGITLNDADNGSGTLLLQNGKLNVHTLGTAARGFNVEVCTVNTGDVVQLGGFDPGDGTTVGGVNGAALDKITLAQGTQLTGVLGDITVGGTNGTTSAMALTLDEANVGTTSTIATGKNAMIGQSGKLIINDGTVVTLSVDAIATMLNAAATNSESVYLHLTTGTLEVADEALGALVFESGATSIDLLETFGVRLHGTEGGSLKLTGGAVGIYTAADDSSVTGYKVLSAYQSTVVASGKSLEMRLDGAANDGGTAVVNNLIGGTDSTLLINNTDDASTARVELKNKLQDIENPDPAEAVGAHTEFAGDIDGTSGAGDVEIVISGDGTLTVGGNVNTAQLTMSEGGLTLNGDANTISTLVDDGVAADATTADSILTVNDMLTVEGESELTGTSVSGDGTLSLKDTLKLSQTAALDGVAVELQKDNFGTAAALVLDGPTSHEVSALNGGGSLQGGNGADLTITGKGGSFSGSLDELAGQTGGATLKIAEGASQTLNRVTGSTAWSVENAGELTINITNPAVTTGTGTNNPLTLDSLTLKSGSTTTMVLNTDAPAKYLNLQELVVEDGATFALQSTGLNEIDFGGSITLAYAANGVTLGDDVAVDLGTSTAFKKVKEAMLVSSADGKSLVLQTSYHDENQYEKMASSGNSAAGASLLWSVNTGALKSGSALKAVDEAVNELSKQGTAAAATQADKIMAAVAGSSTAILGSALSSDVERQLRAIRNRTTTMGVAQCEVNEGMPYVNAWLNAEGDHHEMDADGLAAGYTRDSWGGTVGFDVDLTPSLTMGMAVTAMYGDIESESADKAEGDFDTQYLSLFARYSSNAWTHTFVATVGRADISLNRTVNYGTGSYETTGDTEGISFGFMYEVGRVFALTEDGDVCLQPVANVTFRHSTVDGYEESGCDATLAVDEQTYSAVTLGVGARLQAVVGTSIYNRASILEARALAKFDMGDRESEADVRLTQGGNTATVKSAELGAFGAEFGVGVTVPVGSNAGSIFVDGSAEIRSGYTNINGTVGYRINF